MIPNKPLFLCRHRLEMLAELSIHECGYDLRTSIEDHRGAWLVSADGAVRFWGCAWECRYGQDIGSTETYLNWVNVQCRSEEGRGVKKRPETDLDQHQSKWYTVGGNEFRRTQIVDVIRSFVSTIFQQHQDQRFPKIFN